MSATAYTVQKAVKDLSTAELEEKMLRGFGAKGLSEEERISFEQTLREYALNQDPLLQPSGITTVTDGLFIGSLKRFLNSELFLQKLARGEVRTVASIKAVKSGHPGLGIITYTYHNGSGANAFAIKLIELGYLPDEIRDMLAQTQVHETTFFKIFEKGYTSLKDIKIIFNLNRNVYYLITNNGFHLDQLRPLNEKQLLGLNCGASLEDVLPFADFDWDQYRIARDAKVPYRDFRLLHPVRAELLKQGLTYQEVKEITLTFWHTVALKMKVISLEDIRHNISLDDVKRRLDSEVPVFAATVQPAPRVDNSAAAAASAVAPNRGDVSNLAYNAYTQRSQGLLASAASDVAVVSATAPTGAAAVAAPADSGASCR